MCIRDSYYTGSTSKNSGLVKAATVIKEQKALANKSEKSKVDNVLLVDNGDTIQGTPLANLYAVKNPVKEGAVSYTHLSMLIKNLKNTINIIQKKIKMCIRDIHMP